MRLFLEVLDGEQKGARFDVRDGLVIGRREADVILKDSKVSGRHATIEVRPSGHTYLIDEGSSNGIKVGEHRVRELVLLPGTKFILGRTLIRAGDADSEPARIADPAGRAAQVEIVIEPEAEPTWQEILASLATRAQSEARAKKAEIAPFFPPLRLRFTQGIQTGTEWTIGYGPREVGSASTDLLLEERGVPGTCFKLLPSDEGILLRTNPEANVRLNGRDADAEFLQDGDVIEVKSTRIEVSIGSD